jgi:crossover junction endodeoxyribonuclease RuvC
MTRYIGIDPSTKTGVVVLDEDGDVWEAVEIEKSGKDPQRITSLIDAVVGYLLPGDIVCIEDFAYAQANSMALLGGIGWGIRMAMYRKAIPYILVGTGQLKNYAGCKGNCGKEDLIIPIHKIWGFEDKSDNVRDAFILAQIARGLHENIKLLAYQQKVIESIRNPAKKNAKPAKQKSKRKVG